MRAGTLRERVTIFQPVPTQDAEWGQIEQYTEVDDSPASVKAKAATEDAKASGVASRVVYEIKMRYRDDITSQTRLEWNTKTLDILSAIDPEGRRRELLIEAVEHPTPAVIELVPTIGSNG